MEPVENGDIEIKMEGMNSVGSTAHKRERNRESHGRY